MNISEIVIISLLAVSIAFQYLSLKINARLIRESTRILDATIAEAIKTTVENLPDALKTELMPDLDPPNPIQALIAQALQSRLNPPLTATVTTVRGDDGKFTTDTSS